LFDIFARIDRTFRSDSKSLIFIDIGYALKLWEADKVRQSAIAESGHWRHVRTSTMRHARYFTLKHCIFPLATRCVTQRVFAGRVIFSQ